MEGGRKGCICVSERDWVFGKVKEKIKLPEWREEF